MAESDIDYLVRTATPGGTMSRQGVRRSIERLHPAFISKIAATIRAARAAGLKSAGIYSSYRAPIWGVGGFRNKKKSLHAYGAAVDFAGIGDPGTSDAKLFYKIATENGIYNPYGASHRKEWNHFQLVPNKVAPKSWQDAITANPPANSQELTKIWAATGISPDGYAMAASATPVPPEDVGPLGSRRLDEGNSGPDVRKVQMALKRDGYYDGPIDGEYGSKTKAGVLALQKHINKQRRAAGMTEKHDDKKGIIGIIQEDGVVGPQTRPSLNVRYDLMTAPSPTPRRQSYSNAVDIAHLHGYMSSRQPNAFGGRYNPTEAREARERRPLAVKAVTSSRPTYDALDDGTATRFDFPVPLPNAGVSREEPDVSQSADRNMETPVAEIPLIMPGNKDRSVVAPIQEFLNRMGVADLNVDGDFGPLTEAAVRDYQAEHGLQVDGIVGEKTQAAMLKDTFRMSQEDERNHRVEQALTEWGVIPIPRFRQLPIPRPRPDAASFIFSGRKR